jgi:hypothetical protein
MDGGGTGNRPLDFPNVGVKGSHKCEAHHFFGLHSLQSPPGLDFRQKLPAKLTEVVFDAGKSAERDARP